MKLGIVLRTTGPTPRLDLDFVLEAERLGFDSAWTSEAWGGDAVTTVSCLRRCVSSLVQRGGACTLREGSPVTSMPQAAPSSFSRSPAGIARVWKRSLP
jgi:hypothetical protein